MEKTWFKRGDIEMKVKLQVTRGLIDVWQYGRHTKSNKFEQMINMM